MAVTTSTTRPETLFVGWPDPVRAEDCYWYHTMDVPGIGVTPGNWDLRGKFPEYIGHVNVAGK